MTVGVVVVIRRFVVLADVDVVDVVVVVAVCVVVGCCVIVIVVVVGVAAVVVVAVVAVVIVIVVLGSRHFQVGVLLMFMCKSILLIPFLDDVRYHTYPSSRQILSSTEMIFETYIIRPNIYVSPSNYAVYIDLIVLFVDVITALVVFSSFYTFFVILPTIHPLLVAVVVVVVVTGVVVVAVVVVVVVCVVILCINVFIFVVFFFRCCCCLGCLCL